MSSSVVLASRNAVLEDCFADEVWHGVFVVLKTGSGAVRAGTGVVETGRVAFVVSRSTTAKSTTSVDFGRAPLRSHSWVNSVWIDGGIGSGSSTLRSDEAGENRDGDC